MQELTAGKGRRFHLSLAEVQTNSRGWSCLLTSGRWWHRPGLTQGPPVELQRGCWMLCALQTVGNPPLVLLGILSQVLSISWTSMSGFREGEGFPLPYAAAWVPRGSSHPSSAVSRSNCPPCGGTQALLLSLPAQASGSVSLPCGRRMGGSLWFLCPRLADQFRNVAVWC